MAREFWGGRTVVIDWDGTAAKTKYPKQEHEFMPGFEEAMRRLHREGLRLVIDSARFNQRDAYSGVVSSRSIARANSERAYIRAALDGAGLTFVELHDYYGKAPGFMYVDDRADRYTARRTSWKHIADKALIRFGKEEAVFAAMSGEED